MSHCLNLLPPVSHHHELESHQKIYGKIEVIKHLKTTHEKSSLFFKAYLKNFFCYKKKQRREKKNAKN